MARSWAGSSSQNANPRIWIGALAGAVGGAVFGAAEGAELERAVDGRLNWWAGATKTPG